MARFRLTVAALGGLALAAWAGLDQHAIGSAATVLTTFAIGCAAVSILLLSMAVFLGDVTVDGRGVRTSGMSAWDLDWERIAAVQQVTITMGWTSTRYLLLHLTPAGTAAHRARHTDPWSRTMSWLARRAGASALQLPPLRYRTATVTTLLNRELRARDRDSSH